MLQYSTVQYSTIQYNTIQYNTIQYSTVQCSAVQYITVQYIAVPSKSATTSAVVLRGRVMAASAAYKPHSDVLAMFDNVQRTLFSTDGF